MSNYQKSNTRAVSEVLVEVATAAKAMTGKSLEQQLREEQRLNRQAERLAQLGFWEWDVVDDRLAYCSEGYAHMLDMTCEEMLAAEAAQRRITGSFTPMIFSVTPKQRSKPSQAVWVSTSNTAS